MSRLNTLLRLGLAVVSTGALLLPNVALGAPAAPPASAHIDDDLAQQVASSAPQAPLHVLVEAAGTPGIACAGFGAQAITDLSHGSIGFDRIEDQWQQIR